MMAMRSPRMSASSIECVVNTMARSFLAASMISHVARREMGSMPVVGSSRYTISGSPASSKPTVEIDTVTRPSEGHLGHAVLCCL